MARPKRRTVAFSIDFVTLLPCDMRSGHPSCSEPKWNRSKVGNGEIVAINLDTGIYYSVKGAAALVWNDLIDGHSVEALVEGAQGNNQIHAAIAPFVDELVATGLMRQSSAARQPTGPARIATAATSMDAPVLEPFGDMQDLLLLDPVHEMDEQVGWPNGPDTTVADK